MTPIRVAMVEDDASFATTLQRFFALTKELHCTRVYSSAEAALKEAPAFTPDVLLVDINLPGMSGIEFVARIVEQCPSTVCLMLTMYEESPLIFEALQAGACGYLLKRTPPAEIIAAIKEAKAGGSPMTPHIARHVCSFFRQPASTPLLAPPLAPLGAPPAEREREVLNLLAKGFLYKEIADTLHISAHTVNSYIRRIYEKLHVHSRGQAVAKYRGLAE